jgi:hypothetical protein
MFPHQSTGPDGVSTSFDWAIFWTAAAAIVGALALVGVAFAIASYFKSNPKRRLEYVVTSQKLVNGVLPSGSAVKIAINGVEIADPYFVNVSIVSNSRADIPSTSFDGGAPIRIRSEPGGALMLNADEANAASIGVTGGHGEGMEWAEFVIEPQLIRKRSNVTLTFVSNGPPNVTVAGDLVDIDIVAVNPDRARLLDYVGDVTFSVLGLTFTLRAPSNK